MNEQFDEPEERGREDFIFICPSYLDCVLAAGNANDLPALREFLASLPKKSYGRVFIEVDSLDQAEPIEAPPGVGVTYLERKLVLETPGAALVRAANGWLDEWVRGDPLSGRYVQLWAGARSNLETAAEWQRIELELAEIWAAAAEYREQLT